MKAYLDGQECLDTGGGASSILDAVQRQVAQAGRVVTEIRLDDIVMDEEAFLSVTGGLTASFTSQPVRGLVQESLDEALRYIPRLTRGLEEIAAHFGNNELSVGEKKLADADDGLDWLLNVFQRCGALLVAEDEAGGLTGAAGALIESITALAGFHAEKNYPQMSLCIRQRLVPEIENFSLRVQSLRDLAASAQQ